MGARSLGGLLGAVVVLGLGQSPVSAAPGSWMERAAPLRVARSDHYTCSQPLLPPPLAHDRQLLTLRWSFSAPAGALLQARLCHPQRCTELPGNRGVTRELAGLDAGQPLQLCFRLGAAAAPVPVSDLQVLVDYR